MILQVGFVQLVCAKLLDPLTHTTVLIGTYWYLGSAGLPNMFILAQPAPNPTHAPRHGSRRWVLQPNPDTATRSPGIKTETRPSYDRQLFLPTRRLLYVESCCSFRFGVCCIPYVKAENSVLKVVRMWCRTFCGHDCRASWRGRGQLHWF